MWDIKKPKKELPTNTISLDDGLEKEMVLHLSLAFFIIASMVSIVLYLGGYL